MIKRFNRAGIFPALFLCILLVLVTACSTSPTGSTPTPSGTGHSGPAGNSNGTPGSTPAVQTVPMPATSTDCPALNTARAAVMRPLALGSHQNLVYIYNEVPQNTSTAIGHLRRYDATSGQKSDIITSGIRIDQAQISADGQWVLFLSIPDPRGDSQHSAMLQLVRMDGQGLQTLYCFPSSIVYSGQGASSKLPIALQWSVDQHSILFSLNTNNDTSSIQVLNIATGNLKQLFLDQHDALYNYSVVTWLDNIHFYIIKQGNMGPTPPATVFLMDASTATVANPGLVQIMTTNTRMSYYSLDSSYDGTQLYNSYCLLAASPFTTNIGVGPAMGGARHTIYSQQHGDCIQVMRAVAPNTLLMVVQVANSAGSLTSNQVWTMSLPGNSVHTLTTFATSDSTSYNLNETSQYPWSNLSRNGNAYAIAAADPTTHIQSILVAPLSGGNASSVAITNPGNSSVSVAGWTTL
jgi:hypothetical protein